MRVTSLADEERIQCKNQESEDCLLRGEDTSLAVTWIGSSCGFLERQEGTWREGQAVYSR